MKLNENSKCNEAKIRACIYLIYDNIINRKRTHSNFLKISLMYGMTKPVFLPFPASIAFSVKRK
jgi:hypothetical protein